MLFRNDHREHIAQKAAFAHGRGQPKQLQGPEGRLGCAMACRVDLGIDTVVPMRALETQGKGKEDCTRQFKAAWERFAADEANLTGFLNAKRKRR